MQLIIFEKPKQARSVCNAFGYEDKKSHLVLKPQSPFKNGAIAVWCVGHIMEMMEPKEINPSYKEWNLEHLPMELISYQNQTKMKAFPLKVAKASKPAFDEIKKWLNNPKIKGVIHAGDCARNGQLIVDEVLIYLKNTKPVRRLWINSLEATAVKKGFNALKPNEDYYSYYEEALARQQSDYIIGMNASRLFSLLMQSKGVHEVFPIGRIQSSFLRILADRERAINNFRPTPYYLLQGMFEKDSMTFPALYVMEGERLTDKEHAQSLAKYMSGKEGVVDSIEEKPEYDEPPSFFNLTSLISEMNKRTQQSPEEIQEIAQELYTKGFISYPRADPIVVNPEEAATFPEILLQLQSRGWGNGHLPTPLQDISNNKRYVNSDLTDDHYAIVPTVKVPTKEELPTIERLMYQLISNRLITAHYPAAIYQLTRATILVEDEFSFGLKEKRVEHLGWKVTLETDTPSPKNSNEEKVISMPALTPGESVQLGLVNILEKMTTAPKRFTQGDLPTVMENVSLYLTAEEKKGISKDQLSLGTVATRSSIIKKLMNHHYIQVKKNKVYVQGKAFILMEALGPDSWITSPRTSGVMEQYLADIGKKKSPAPPFVRRTQQIVNELIKELKDKAPTWQLDPQYMAELKECGNPYTSIGKCLLCGGDVVDKGSFYGCLNYNTTKCGFSISKTISGQKISQKQVELILTKQRSDTLSNFKKKNKEGTFKAQLIWSDQKGQILFDFTTAGI